MPSSCYFCPIVFWQNCTNHLLADWNNDPVGVQGALACLPPDCRSGKQNCTHKNPSLFVMLSMSSDGVWKYDVASEFRIFDLLQPEIESCLQTYCVTAKMQTWKKHQPNPAHLSRMPRLYIQGHAHTHTHARARFSGYRSLQSIKCLFFWCES